MASTSSVNPTVSCPISLSSSETAPPSKQASPDSALWDVFLSFRGEDTRLKFTNHLYNVLDIHGLRTFRDKPELLPGEVISESLIQAIQNSKTYVVVFSQDYASSPWCLDELVEIYKCYQQKNRLVIGVYYHINPSVVRHQKESFKDAFEKHITGRYHDKIDQVNQWRHALKGVADFSGLPISATSDADDVDIINEIARVILEHVKPKPVPVADHFVARGILQLIKNTIKSSLKPETVKGVIKIGLHGLGGVGKTTLAKALYNHLLKISDFKASCCFLADVREIYGRPNGLVSLQNQLISALTKSKTKDEVPNNDQGAEYIRKRFGFMKVLLVIDDIDKFEQCKSLMGPYANGSVVIITTRDTTTLDNIKVEPTHRFQVNVMNDAESLKLFTAHAFPNTEPDKTLMALFGNDILHLAGGLPLALQVFGSYLSMESKEGWEDYIKKLKLNPNSTILDRLMISLNAMDDLTLKNIFIDIACFFNGIKLKEAVKIMETCYPVNVDHNIRILIKRSLLTITHGNHLRMHDLLRDMGREVARNKFPRDKPEKHSRLWVLEDICNVLQKQKGTDSITGIIPSSFYYHDALEGVKLSTTTIKKMSKLRFFYLKDVYITGSFEHTFEDLTWLRWDFCPLTELPSHFRPEKLVVLKLLDSKIKKWELNKVFENLKTLNMSNSINLTTTPDFTKLPNLEKLYLDGCKRLKKVDIQIDSLMKLVSFTLSGCVKLTNIHVISSSSLRLLEFLDVSDCENLEILPHQLWETTSLKKITLGTNGRGYFDAPFKHLSISADRFTALPSFCSHFLHLEDLDLYSCPNLLSIEKLPPNLKKLRICDCISLERLPNLFELTQLEHIDLSLRSGLTEIQGLQKLTSIRELILDGCNSSLHENILSEPFFQVLQKLKTLDMSYSRYLTDMSDFTMLPSLESLMFMGCPRLKKVLISAKRLTELVSFDLSGCRTLKEIHISNESLLKLVSFNLSGCVELRSIHIGSSSFSQLLSLKYLNLDNCCKLLSIEQLPPNLKELHLDSCESLESLPNLSSLTQLEVLDITCCRGLTEIKGLEELTSIYNLGLDYCKWTLQTQILTESFFQIYSGLKHMVRISAGQFPNWFKPDLCTEYGLTYMIPKCGLDILAVIIFLEEPADYIEFYECVVENVTSGKSYRCIESMALATVSIMIILPRSIFSAKEGDELYVRSYKYIWGIHLVYDE